ncbi:MAG: trypsin-like peptidase domain-containing protein [Pirellulales bacterium]
MANRNPRIVLAEEREMGVPCAQCGREIRLGDPTAICQDCGAVHHASCWHTARGCAAYECAATTADSGQLAMLSITRAELAAAEPIVARSVADSEPAGGATGVQKKRWNRTAVWAFIIAIIGIPAFGLLTGLFAMVIGCIALAGHTRHRRGLSLAVAGILIGLFDVIGWAAGLAYFLGTPHSLVALEQMTIDPSSLKELPERIARSMRANVLIETRAGFTRQGMGSGVILKLLGGSAYIVTNRHVVDQNFADGSTSVPEDLSGLAKVMVMTVEQISVPGKVEWIAPHGVDLAIVSAPIVSGEVREAHWDADASPHTGDEVYAVGNPYGLGWTHSAGDISQVRQRNHNGFSYRVLQTTAAINPGNSGGGLYDAQGRLIGINTMTSDKRMAEGLAFSIALPTLLKLVPEQLGLANKNLGGEPVKATPADPEAPPK